MGIICLSAATPLQTTTDMNWINAQFEEALKIETWQKLIKTRSLDFSHGLFDGLILWIFQ